MLVPSYRSPRHCILSCFLAVRTVDLRGHVIGARCAGPAADRASRSAGVDPQPDHLSHLPPRRRRQAGDSAAARRHLPRLRRDRRQQPRPAAPIRRHARSVDDRRDFFTARRYASAGNSYGPVSLSVCLSVTSRRSIETAE